MKNIKAVAFDLDGTVYLGDKLIDGAAKLISYLKNKSIKIFYFTNNSTKTRQEIYRKLCSLGLSLKIVEVYTSSHATARYLKEKGISKIFCIGSTGLLSEIKSQGIDVTGEENKAEALVVGLDKDFNYSKLSKALDAIQNGCLVIACNRDKSFPIESNKFMPGCGPIVSAVECLYEKEVDYIVGKPNTYMIELLAEEWGLSSQQILVVGDSYSSDIEMAKRFKCPSILISGNNYPDTIVVKDISEIRNLF